MFIKQITIQGFKSYKDQTIIEPFSPKHNVIVGRNGSGKSNFFAAIRFVLSDQYTQMGREERANLLHEGTGSAVMSAYVEITFDNQDQRFPTDTPEVVLRRTIGQKKDEYSLNRKNTTKNEVMNMLETAGFSRSNPYYIVPQGRITAITNMQDPARLEILKNVAGTTVYDQRRAESRKIMDETEHKRSKIDELLEHIRGRLDELEEEKEELRAFQEKDRERRCLEFTIHNKDEEALDEALERLEEDREGGVDQTDEDRAMLDRSQDEIEEIDSEISELQTQIKLLSEEKAQLEDERKTEAKKKAKVELDVQSMLENQNTAQQARNQHDSDLRDVQAQIKQREAELAQLLPEYNAKLEQERALKQQAHDAEATCQRLYAKQGRQAQFRTKKDRDTFLRNEINDVNVALATRKAVTMQTTEEITELENQIGKLEADIAERRARIDNRGDEQQNISAQVTNAKEERDRLQDQRRELWREEARLDSVIENAKQELDKAEKFLSTMMDQNTNRGINAVRRIVREHNIEGAYGTLGELFDFSDKYKTAIEVTAGTSLFHYVVDTDETATHILQILQKEEAGRVTFMPLNRLKPKPANIPKASDAVHLVTKLRYDERFDKAFQQVFGKTIVCPNLQVASQYARSHGVTAITPDGDRSDKKGALTGGYHDSRKSRTDGLKRLVKARGEYDGHSSRKQEIARELRSLDQKITKAMSDLMKIEQTRMQMEGNYGPLREELRRREAELNQRRDEMDRKRRSRENVESLVRDLGNQLEGYQAELGSDFKKALTNEEERQLEHLSAQLPELRKQFGEASSQRSELEARKSAIDVELRENLRLRLDHLLSMDLEEGGSVGDSGSNTRLKERQRDLDRVSKALDALNQKLAENETAAEEAKQQLQQVDDMRTNKARQIEELTRAIRNHQKSVEKGAQKRAALKSRLDEVGTQIRNLGVLPDAAFKPPYNNMTANVATARLHKVQDALKKYGGRVNKKAFEQFAQFERQREILESRRKELGESDGSIRQLIEVLDQRKDEAIERTFRQVSREFARIFEKLVPAGKGRLVIQRRSDRQARQAEDSEDEQDQAERPGGGVENYTGVGISVSFNSKHDEQQRIQQLSGGQKSLCALALVFAIQASDPAPFYLFDEIDANLDAQYRRPLLALVNSPQKSTVCFSCARKLARAAHRGDRSFHHALRAKQVVVAKGDNVDRKFFWQNAFRRDQAGQSSEVHEGRVQEVLMSKDGVKQAKDVGQEASTTADAALAAEEPPHRRRKRIKEEAVAAAQSAADAPLPPDASSTLSRSAAAAPAQSWKRTFSTYLALTKPRLAFLIVLTTTASYSIYPTPDILSTSAIDAPSLSTLTLLFLTSGTFLAIASANTLNMLFEPAHDAKMSRTKNRPLVRGLVSKRAATLFAVASGLLGTALLWEGVNPTTAILGATNIGLYAFAYTPLKRIHPVNTWVGAIVGAIPPLMGWCAAASQYSTTNATIADPASIIQEAKELLFTEQAAGGWLIAALLFAWQFPHFFALSHGVRNEYASAGYKMLTSTNTPMAARVSLRYSLAMFPICGGLSYYQVTDPSFLVTSSIINGWMLREAWRFWWFNAERGSARALFWASVWQLPIALVLAMVQKKGLGERLWRGITGEPEYEDEWDDE